MSRRFDVSNVKTMRTSRHFDRTSNLIRDLGKRGGWSTYADLKTVGWGTGLTRTVREAEDWRTFVLGKVMKGGTGRPARCVAIRSLRDAGVLQDPYFLGLEDVKWDDEFEVDIPALPEPVIRLFLAHGLTEHLTDEERASIALTPSAREEVGDYRDMGPIRPVGDLPETGIADTYPDDLGLIIGRYPGLQTRHPFDRTYTINGDTYAASGGLVVSYGTEPDPAPESTETETEGPDNGDDT